MKNKTVLMNLRVSPQFKQEIEEFVAENDVPASVVMREGAKMYMGSGYWIPVNEELYYLLEDYCEMNKVTMKEVVTKAILRYID